MDPLRRFNTFLCLLVRNLPPVSTGRLLMPAVFLGTWTALRAFSAPEPVAFVWAAVLAQAAQAWGVLPNLAKHRVGKRPRDLGAVTIAAILMPAALSIQVWSADPLVTQRLLSTYCAVYATVMALGIWGDRDVLAHFVPVGRNSDVPLAFRQHLLKLYVLLAILLLALNEALIATDAPLGSRVIALSIAPIFLHYFFEIALRLSCPPLNSEND